MTDEKPFSVKTLKEFFGFREGTKLADFGAELKALSDEEKTQLCNGIEDGTLDY